MGRNRKGRQCGGYESKMERCERLRRCRRHALSINTLSSSFVLQRKWQREMARTVSQQRKRHAAAPASSSAGAADASRARRVVRVDVVKALMDARLKDDRVERIKLQSIGAIASQLEETSRAQPPAASLQDRCVRRAFDYERVGLVGS